MSSSPFFASTLCLALVCGGLQARAAIVADFTDGNGNISSNQYPGTAGDGWSTAWGVASANSGSTTVTNTSPLAGGGNYLQFTKTTTSMTASLRRGYQSTPEVDITQPYRISFDYRYNTSLTGFTVFGDRLAISGDTSPVAGTATTNTWLIGVAASNSGVGAGQSVYAGNWFFFDNNGTSDFNTGNMVDTGLALVSGRTYTITVDVDPLTGTYAASIDDGVNPVFSASDLTFRRGAGAVTSNYLIYSLNTSANSEVVSFSIDNVMIAVPEPGATGIAVATGFAALLLGARRRRRR